MEKYKTIVLRLTPEIISRIDQIVKKDGQTRSSFIRQAVNRALKNWKSPLDNPSLWPACRHCGRHHDPEAYHGTA